MLTPSQEFEQLLDRYRITEGLCAPESGGAEDAAPERPREPPPPLGRGAVRSPLAGRVCGIISRYGRH